MHPPQASSIAAYRGISKGRDLSAGQGLAEPEKEEAEEDAGGGVEQGGEELAVFQQFDILGGEGGEGGEGTTETYGEHQHEGTGGVAVNLGDAGQPSQQEAAGDVHQQCAQRHGQEGYASHQSAYAIAQESPDGSSQHNKKTVLYHENS